MFIDRKLAALFVLLVILNTLDAATTLMGFSLGAEETNSITIFLLQNLGVAGAFLLKFSLVFFFGFMGLFTYHYALLHDRGSASLTKRILMAAFGVACLCYIPIVIGNFFVLSVIWI